MCCKGAYRGERLSCLDTALDTSAATTADSTFQSFNALIVG